MQINVDEQLGALLYEHDSVILPGFGAFETQDAKGGVDAVQGRIDAPARTVTFNPNLVLDDGRLVGHLQQTYAISRVAAQGAVQQYVSTLQGDISGGEIVEIPRVGRIYRDYERKIRFLPDAHNYKKDAYGLPDLTFYPLARNERPKTVVAPTPPPVSATPAPPTPVRAMLTGKGYSKGMSDWLQRNLSWLAAASLVVIAFAIYLIFLRPDPALQANDPFAGLPRERTNVPPPITDPADDPYVPAESLTPATPDPADEAELIGPTDNVPADTEAPTLSPNQKSAVIAVGMFGSEDNVKRMIKQIYSAGYEPYTARQGNLTRVGVRVAYEKDSELSAHLSRVKRKLEDGAFVLEGVK